MRNATLLLLFVASACFAGNRPHVVATADAGCSTDSMTAAPMAVVAPGAAAIRCRPWEFGTAMQGYVWEAPNARAVLLLQHGLAEYAQRYTRSYRELIPRLLAMGVTVYAFDLPGHGRSPGTGGVVNAEDAVAHHLAARRALRGQSLPVFFYGHSLGGLVTATSVARDPRDVAGVILSSSLLHSESGRVARPLIALMARVSPAWPLVKAPASVVSSLPDEVERFVRDTMIYHGALTAMVAASGVRLSGANWPLYPRWTAPVLVLHGEDDLGTNPAGSRRFFEAITATDRTLHIVADGRHELLNDAGRDETLGVVLDWLSRRLQ